jgi:RNA-directed DNA polymerase
VKREFTAALFQRTADTRNLRCSWDHLAKGDGQAPGIDGLRYDDLADHEVWDLIRVVNRAILDDTYRHDKDRKVKIRKSSGKGYRTLSIPTIVDRMVQRGITQMIEPYLDPQFDVNSFGFRPGGDINKALARAEELTIQGDRWVWLTEDLTDAFNHVPQRRLLDIIRRDIPNGDLMRMIERVVLTRSGMGIRQGGNLSPLLLNIYLNHFLDKKWRRQHPDMILIRWADDLLILCRTLEEALEAYRSLGDLLRPTGMTLKSTPKEAIRDLGSGDHAEWLGYRLQRERMGLKAHLTDKAWDNLGEHLELCHIKDHSPLRAIETIMGWIGSKGACLPQEDVPETYARVVSLAQRLAFDEIPPVEAVYQEWWRAYRRWKQCRRAA